ANPASFFLRGSPERLRDVWQAGVALARAAEPPPRYLLADIGAFEAGAEEKVRHLRDCRELIAALAHVDGLLAETWSDLPSLISLLEANDCVQPNGPWPVLVSVTYQRDAGGRLATQHGESPQFWARQISQQPSVVALGVNCGRDIGMAETIDIIKRYREFTGLPLFARPNAGTPTKTNGKWGFPQSAQGMVDELPALLDAGVRMIGGCCGTTPDYIAAFKPVVDQWNAPEKSRTL
ncbi:MAG: homocysteine S-methyltransferase family protein, partial [Candidatus Acidiferrum sp.]